MKIKIIINGFFFGNCYLIWEEDRNCIIIDPGDEEELIMHSISELGLIPRLIVATHVNVDSIGAAAAMREAFGVPFAIHREEAKMFDFIPNMARYLGLPQIKLPAVDRWLADGEIVEVVGGGGGKVSLQVIHTPGHTPGSICLYTRGAVFTGDTLIAGSYGRTDMRGGSEETILESIHNRLFVLDDATVVYPGHGPTTTIGEEKKKNWAVFRKKRDSIP